MSQFGEYASFYDLFYKEKDYPAEADYLAGVMNQYSLARGQLLDLGCGTGRHAICLAAKGYVLTGIDISENMLTQARQNLSMLPDQYRGNIEFIQGDIADFNTGQSFAFIYSVFHVVSYLTSDNAIAGLVDSVARHLAPGGLFVFDVWYGPGVLAQQPEQREHTYQSGTSVIHRQAIPELYPEDNTVRIQYTIDINGGQRQIVEQHVLRYFFRPELETLLGTRGMGILAVLDGFSNRPVDESTWSATFVARRTETD